MKLNPFRPNSPVNPGMFIGRVEEIHSLEQALVQTKADSPSHFMITGERGMGKTSLFLYLKYLATGLFPYEDVSFNFLVIDLDIDSKTTQQGLVERVAFHLENGLAKSEPARKFFADAWSFLQRVRVKGTGIESQQEDNQLDEVLLDQFATSLSNILERICNDQKEGSIFSARYDGIIILIDEADNASIELSLGSFLKLTLERLQRRGCSRLLVGLAGLPELRNKLYSSHPSSVRIFQELPLNRLSDPEVTRVIEVCIERANKGAQESTTITQEAKELLVSLSEGFPHFIQQFGYSAFAQDSDNEISKGDVNASAFEPRGALEVIGDRYYRYDFYNKIQGDKYRQVLRIMADDLDGWVSRAKIQSKFKGKPSILNNAIKALRDRHIILSKEGAKGVYRLQHKGFALWIKLYAEPPVGSGSSNLASNGKVERK